MFNSLSLKVILFGFIFTFFSSFGQSFFLGLFNSSIRDALSITHGQFGTIYASATLLSSLVIIWVGKKIDDIDVFKFGSFVTLLLSFSCYFFSKVSSVTFLFIAIFLMRFSGQGLMSHTASTSVDILDGDEARQKAKEVIMQSLSLSDNPIDYDTLIRACSDVGVVRLTAEEVIDDLRDVEALIQEPEFGFFEIL